MDNNLKTILRNEQDADFFISTPRTGYLKLTKFGKFAETFEKKEATKMEAERISPDGETVKIWIRSFSNNTYMLRTAKDNVLIPVPER